MTVSGRSCIGFVGLIALAACIPHVSVEGAPCPCPEGYACCSTLAQCLADGKECPGAYPASSGQACAKDRDCPRNELCQSWTTQEQMFGPQQCRRACPSEYPCGDGEACELTPHDGLALDAMSIGRICVPAIPPEGCKDQRCRDCVPSQLGKTFCDGKAVRGWFVGFHPQCGLVCRSIIVDECMTSHCVEVENGADCETRYFGEPSPCVTLPCSLCGAPAGSPFCHVNDVAACLSVAFTDRGGACDELCSIAVIESCTSCVEDHGPQCGP